MNEDRSEPTKINWVEKIRDHWIAFTFAILLAIGAAASAITVLLWFIDKGSVIDASATIGDWSIAIGIKFVIFLILWELLLVGLPLFAVGGISFWIWWSRLGADEKKELKSYDKSHKSKGGKRASGGTFFINLAYILYIAIQGNFTTPFGDLQWTYWVYSYLWTIVWLAIIIGIPGLIGGIFYLKYTKH